ncbi:hypothetical protein DH2020_023427 [Rehmannia glutinosa]|uniref:Uncharacterized protein n=1 Tax=Rehmannia glutinosa TaxID=99300 RepID=A0ABR0W7U0_REHGL
MIVLNITTIKLLQMIVSTTLRSRSLRVRSFDETRFPPPHRTALFAVVVKCRRRGRDIVRVHNDKVVNILLEKRPFLVPPQFAKALVEAKCPRSCVCRDILAIALRWRFCPFAYKLLLPNIFKGCYKFTQTLSYYHSSHKIWKAIKGSSQLLLIAKMRVGEQHICERSSTQFSKEQLGARPQDKCTPGKVGGARSSDLRAFCARSCARLVRTFSYVVRVAHIDTCATLNYVNLECVPCLVRPSLRAPIAHRDLPCARLRALSARPPDYVWVEIANRSMINLLMVNRVGSNSIWPDICITIQVDVHKKHSSWSSRIHSQKSASSKSWMNKGPLEPRQSRESVEELHMDEDGRKKYRFLSSYLGNVTLYFDDKLKLTYVQAFIHTAANNKRKAWTSKLIGPFLCFKGSGAEKNGPSARNALNKVEYRRR